MAGWLPRGVFRRRNIPPGKVLRATQVLELGCAVDREAAGYL